MSENIIRVDFDKRDSESQYFEIETDKLGQPSVFVSVLEEGIELIQIDEDGFISEVQITDGQLQGVLAIFAQEVLAEDNITFDPDEGVTYQ